MSIDGIGKPPGGPPAATGGVGKVDAPRGEEFRVERPGVEGASGTESLRRLEQGELTIDQYLDQRTADAVRHLEGRLSPEHIEFVRQSMREQLATDPVLVELVRRATGALSAER